MKILLTLSLYAAGIASATDPPPKAPNIVYMMSDELAYFELGHMGNDKLKTPRIDRMAAEGMRFTRALAGSPVCAPLRCNLMTGKHSGHASVRANDGGTPLRADEVTVASILNEVGYATGGFGKWGAGGRDSTGVPEKHGFDVFFGYYDQVHAHSFYPPYLVRNSEEVVLKGNQGGRSGETYSHYEIMREGLEFIRANQGGPFFCYFPITPPHGMYDIPEDDPAWHLYKDSAWMRDPKVPQDVKNYAAMVSMVDRNLGEVLDLLEELGLEKNTMVFLTGDNGGQDRFSSKEHPRGFFGPNVDPKTGAEFRGGKGNLYEGGLKIPFLVRWPDKIEAGKVSDLLFYQPDVLPTLAELAGGKVPEDIDGISILPELLGAEAVGREQGRHEFLYWEFGQQVAVRIGDWKGIRPKKEAEWELYDLSVDVSEKNSVAGEHPDTVAKMKAFAEASHEDVRPGVYLDPERKRHEKDRRAKFGTSGEEPKKVPKGKGKAAHRIEGEGLIPPEAMRLVRFSSENDGNGKLARNALDGDPETLWHTQFQPKMMNHPHELVIDLGAEYAIRGFRYLARQDGGWNGAFGKTEFFVGDTEDHFGDTPAASAEFGKVKAAQGVDLKEGKRGRYVLVRVLSEVNGAAFASAAEIGVVGESLN